MAHPWEVSDKFWNLMEPLIPKKKWEAGRPAGGW